jgi:hypothetical protein
MMVIRATTQKRDTTPTAGPDSRGRDALAGAEPRARRNSDRVKKPGGHSIRHVGPPAGRLRAPVLNKAMTSITA